MKQVDAVIAAVMQVKPDFKQYSDKGLEVIVDDLRQEVSTIVTAGIIDGTVSYSKDKNDYKAVADYVPGMVSNWLRRSKVLNGNMAPSVKNPGSRIGANDAKLKTLRELRKTQIEPEILSEIDKYIKARLKELKQQKTTKQKSNINFDVLPADLREKLKNG